MVLPSYLLGFNLLEEVSSKIAGSCEEPQRTQGDDE